MEREMERRGEKVEVGKTEIKDKQKAKERTISKNKTRKKNRTR